MITVSARVHGRGGGGSGRESRRVGQVRRGAYPDHLCLQTRCINKARAPGNVSHHVGRQSDAVSSTTPAAAGWSRTSKGSVSFGGTHSGQGRGSQGAGGRSRAVVARGDTGCRGRDKKRCETPGRSHCRDGRQKVDDIGCQERVSKHGGTHSRRAGRVRWFIHEGWWSNPGPAINGACPRLLGDNEEDGSVLTSPSHQAKT